VRKNVFYGGVALPGASIMTSMPHQAASKALGAVVLVAIIRDTSDGTVVHAVTYESGGSTRWLSRHRFLDVELAEAGALVLADFLGARYAG
jgi:hypothetical protein